MSVFRRLPVGLLALLLMTSAPRTAVAGQETVTLEIGGTVAVADLVEPEEGARKEGLLVITHGTLAHKDMELVQALQNALAERGVASLAHTLTLSVDRREGMYDCATPHRHKHEDALVEIGAWIDWAKANGAGPISLLGHSRGGNQTAWFMAERGQGAISRLVLLAPATRGPEGGAAKVYRDRYKAELAPILAKAQALVSQGKGDTLMALPGFLYCPDAKASAAAVVSYYGEEPRRDTPSLLPKLKLPVLVIAGSADTVVPDVPERVGPLADGKKIRLEVIQDASHMFLDFYAEDAADLIAEFVKAEG